jgi:hypothetical protein
MKSAAARTFGRLPRAVEAQGLCYNLQGRGEAMTLAQLLGDKRQDILQIAAQRGATNVRVFGSVVRGCWPIWKICWAARSTC